MLASCSRFVPACLGLCLLLGLAGCGGGSSNPTVSGNTAVTVMATSTANDQLFNFPIQIQSLTLTSQNGPSQTLIASSLGEEFIHVNGKLEQLAGPLVVPQGVYTAASVAISNMDPACAGPYIFNGAIQSNGNPAVTVNLPQPIQIHGTAMTLLLNLDVSQSGPFSGGCPSGIDQIAFNPVFELTAAPQDNAATSSIYGLVEIVAAASNGDLSTNSMNDMNVANPPSGFFQIGSGTVIQGGSGISALASGVPIDLDAVLQPDGTLFATRVEILDANPSNLSAAYGAIFQYDASRPGSVLGLETQSIGNVLSKGFSEYGFANASFGISNALSNVSSLPFAASFNASNMVAGQNVFVSTHVQPVNGFPPGPPLPVSSLKLLPQIVDGQVISTGTVGSFTTYTIQLASYNLFPSVAQSGGQVNQLNNPATVVVYADSSTRKMTSSSIGVGNTYLFNGLIFNDNGTLRMDCAQINDGVPQ